MSSGKVSPEATIDYTAAQDAALALADRGIPVFPVKLIDNDKKGKRDKVPIISDWPNRASKDRDQITVWFRGGGLLIGVPTGSRSGFDVIDVDPRNGGDIWLAENRHVLPA